MFADFLLGFTSIEIESLIVFFKKIKLISDNVLFVPSF